MSDTFPSLIQVALGKLGTYLLLIIGITRNVSPKTASFGIICQFSSVYMNILLVKPIFL